MLSKIALCNNQGYHMLLKEVYFNLEDQNIPTIFSRQHLAEEVQQFIITLDLTARKNLEFFFVLFCLITYI